MTNKRVLVWGTADLGKPRSRILLKGLRANNILVGECLFDIWSSVEDKSQVNAFGNRLRLALRYFVAYPILIWRYLRAPRHDAVFVAYMGHFDVLVLWPFAKMRGAKIMWDAFLSLYDTVVEDRALSSPNSFAARIVSSIERLACSAADIIILDTVAHAAYFQDRYNISPHKLVSVWVGAETKNFSPAPPAACVSGKGAFHVLFYGQFIPLHGIEFIIDAARLTDDPSITWTIVGRGQDKERIDALVGADHLPQVKFIDWVPYEALPETIAQADICLGVFGESAKAARVIPNKIFQVLAVGRPLITRDSPAIREILSPDTPGIWLVPAGSGPAIADAVQKARQWCASDGGGDLYEPIRENISPDAIGKSLLGDLDRLL